MTAAADTATMTTTFHGEIHPLAGRWPMLPADELAALAESIATEGLRVPLTLDGAGRLIDGRNRLASAGALRTRGDDEVAS